MTQVIHVQIEVESTKDLRAIFLQNEPHGGLFLRGRENISAGTKVVVNIHCGEEVFQIPARVIWRRTRESKVGPQILEKGAAVAFSADQADAVRRLLAFAQDPQVTAAKRTNTRVGASLKVRYNSFFALARDLSSDVSLGGMRIVSENPPDIGAHVQLVLALPRSLRPLHLTGEVVWQRHGELASFGVRFIDVSPAAKKRLARLIWRLQAPK